MVMKVLQQQTLMIEQYISHKGKIMLHYAAVFFVIAIIAAVFGFGGIASGAASIAHTLFFIFLVIAVVTFVVHLFQGKKT